MSRYIDATDIAKQIADFKKSITSPNSDYMTGYICALSVIEGMIANAMIASTADVVEVRHGEWVHSERGFDVPGDYECSLCRSPEGVKHFYRGEPHYAFCPNCGAKMDRERSENGK